MPDIIENNAKLVAFTVRISPRTKKAFVKTKPQNVTMQGLVEACFKHWVKLSAKERQKLLLK